MERAVVGDRCCQRNEGDVVVGIRQVLQRLLGGRRQLKALRPRACPPVAEAGDDDIEHVARVLGTGINRNDVGMGHAGKTDSEIDRPIHAANGDPAEIERRPVVAGPGSAQHAIQSGGVPTRFEDADQAPADRPGRHSLPRLHVARRVVRVPPMEIQRGHIADDAESPKRHAAGVVGQHQGRVLLERQRFAVGHLHGAQPDPSKALVDPCSAGDLRQR